MSIDLHTHTTASDGALAPAELLQRAAEAGITMLAITDHDCIDGYLEARQSMSDCRQAQSQAQPLQLISGVELSAEWNTATVHMVGLNFSPRDSGVTEFLARQAELRAQRNSRILLRLEKQGLDNIGQQIAIQTGQTEEGMLARIGRPHIAAAIVALGAASDTRKAFKKYLLPGKPAAVSVNWPSLQVVNDVIQAAGGVTVLAHPLHYKLTASKLHRLVAAFAEAGGDALEVVSGAQDKERCKTLARLAERFEMRASVGSDFHSDDKPWQRLGGTASLPVACKPVWADWLEAGA